MAFFVPLLLGAAATGGAAALAKKRKPSTEQLSTLSPEQEAVQRPLASFLASRIGQGLPGFPEFQERVREIAQPTGLETAGLGRLGEFVGEEGRVLGAEQETALARLLGGETPEFFTPERVTELFERGIRGPTIRRFREETLPQIRESFIGPGQLFGTARAEAERRAARDIEEQLGAQEAQLQLAAEERRAALGEGALQRMGEALGLAPDVTRAIQGFPLEQAEAALSLGGLERQLAAAQLQAELQEFIRTQPESSPIISQALQLLGIPTRENIVREAPAPGPLEQALGTFGGALLGQAAGGLPTAGGTLRRVFQRSTPSFPISSLVGPTRPGIFGT
jgi:hypothetical protein